MLTTDLIMIDMREVSGQISCYVKIMKDKYGEMLLNIMMMGKFLTEYFLLIKKMNYDSDKLALYVIKRVLSILKKLEKVHEDYYIEYEKGFQNILDFIREDQTFRRIALEEGGVPKQFHSL